MSTSFRINWQRASTMPPQRVDGECAVGIGIVGVEQHLHFILQTSQQGGRARRRCTSHQPWIDIAAYHPIERGSWQIGKHIRLG